MKTPPLNLTFKQIETSEEKQQQILDEVFEILFDSISDIEQNVVIEGLTIPGV